MNTLTISIPHPTLEQLINFAGISSLASILWLIVLMISAPAMNPGFYATNKGKAMFNICFWLAVNPIGFSGLAVLSLITKSDVAAWTAFHSSPFVVFYLSALCGII